MRAGDGARRVAGEEGSRLSVLCLLTLSRHAPMSTAGLARQLRIDVDLIGAALDGLAQRRRIRLSQSGGWEIGGPR